MRSWLPDNLHPKAYAAIIAALNDVGEHEVPMHSNRGPYVDALNAAVGSPLGSYWCATALASWYRQAGLAMPKSQIGACETWRVWAISTARFDSRPELGGAVLYGTSPTHASHCGLVVSLDPLWSVEANTSLDGYSRDGEVVTCKPVRTELVLGYIHRSPLD